MSGRRRTAPYGMASGAPAKKTPAPGERATRKEKDAHGQGGVGMLIMLAWPGLGTGVRNAALSDKTLWSSAYAVVRPLPTAARASLVKK